MWVVYHSKMKTKQVYLHDSTYATPFSLLLWGARVRHERPRGHTKKEAVEVVIGEKYKSMFCGVSVCLHFSTFIRGLTKDS